MPSNDSRYANAEEDIIQHTVNNDDWQYCWVFEDKRFPLQNGAAIFAGQARSILPIMRRIVELGSRGYDLSNLTKFGNAMQMDSLHKLFLLHYGKNLS